MGTATPSLVSAHASPTGGAHCASTLASVLATDSVTQSMATAPVMRAGGHPHVPRRVSVRRMPWVPPVTS